MIGKQKAPSGRGDGKWETNRSLANYRKARNKRNKAQKRARRRNRR